MTTPPPDDLATDIASAIAALTAAARRTYQASTGEERYDFGEIVTRVLAAVAANIGGVEELLAGRSGSWEAEGVRQLLHSTVGHDEQYLLEHRTEPLVVDVYVDELMVDLDVWSTYDEATQELTRRYDAIGIPSVTGVPGDRATEEALARLEPATEDQERQAEAITVLEDRLEQLREQDWAAYGEAVKTHIEAAAGRLEGLRVPVVVNVDLQTFRRDRDAGDPYRATVAGRLLDEAIQAVPRPGDGRAPLARLEDGAAPPSTGE